MQISQKISLAFLLLITTFGIQAEKMYIWKDQNGVVNFGDQPETNVAKEVDINSNPHIDQDALERNKNRNQFLKNESEKEQQRNQEDIKVQENNSETERKCAEAKKMHSGYMNAQFLYEKTADGSRALVPTERREQALTEVQQYIEKYCK